MNNIPQTNKNENDIPKFGKDVVYDFLNSMYINWQAISKSTDVMIEMLEAVSNKDCSFHFQSL